MRDLPPALPRHRAGGPGSATAAGEDAASGVCPLTRRRRSGGRTRGRSAAAADALALDLGCGETFHRPACEHAGYTYVGLDHASDQATVLGDAHALPFKDNSVDFILSLAVFEHIRYPFVAIPETHRVLRPGRPFIGTVAFLEPYHGASTITRIWACGTCCGSAGLRWSRSPRTHRGPWSSHRRR
ncbi:MAG: class I SAM-dependent methyltransferase [bacterium]